MIATTEQRSGGGIMAVAWSSDTLTPVSAALRLQDRLAFILESVEGGARYGRYSFVGVRGRILTMEADTAVVRDADYVELERFPATDPLEALRRVLPAATGGRPRLPLPALGRRGLPGLRGGRPLGAPARPRGGPGGAAGGALPHPRRGHRLRPPRPDGHAGHAR